MRLRHPDGQLIHLGYCTDVHPAGDLAGVLAQLDTFVAAVRRHLDGDVLGLGLWLAAPVAAALADAPVFRRRLRRELDARGVEVVALNGVPYRHPQPEQPDSDPAPLHQPDWTSRDRLTYTLDLARILADLLPPDAARGSVTTLPLAWRTPWDSTTGAAAARLLDELAEGLTDVAWRTGRLIQVGFEPTPGFAIETTEQAIEALRNCDPDRIGVSLDLGHLAGTWEDPAQVLNRLSAAGLSVVKLQISAALQADDPAEAEKALRGYAPAPGRSAVRNRAGEGADDLAEALGGALAGPWRITCHPPVYASPTAPLTTTLPVLREGLRAVLGGPTAECDHIELEISTWPQPHQEQAPCAGGDAPAPAAGDGPTRPGESGPTHPQGSGPTPAAAGPVTDPIRSDPTRSDPERCEAIAAAIAAELSRARDDLCGLGMTPLTPASAPAPR